MNDLDTFLTLCEEELKKNRQFKLSDKVMNVFFAMPDSYKIICRPVVFFLSRRFEEIEKEVGEANEAERIKVCKLICWIFQLHTNQPAYSSYLIEQAWKSVMCLPDAHLSDFCIAILDVLCESEVSSQNFNEVHFRDFFILMLVFYRKQKQLSKLAYLHTYLQSWNGYLGKTTEVALTLKDWLLTASEI